MLYDTLLEPVTVLQNPIVSFRMIQSTHVDRDDQTKELMFTPVNKLCERVMKKEP